MQSVLAYQQTSPHGKRCENYAGGAVVYDDDEPDAWADPDEDAMELVQIGAERAKNVLVLMSDTGGGHRASAEAIRDAFRIEFGDSYRVFCFWCCF